ncbi:helicase-related protein [Deinococcus aquatilis]|uniref:helicase-related protein n=1 Tax=Deinococcus aquatilis TaxID=519440 RepID=UPI0003810E35|nr:helicase-related protein [Deinococcus aquatilis]
MAGMPHTPLPDFTDNETQYLSSVLTALIGEYEQRRMDIATGFFSPNVWNVIGGAFSQLEHLRLMLGKEPDMPLDRRGLELKRFFRQQLRKELEGETLGSAYAEMIDQLVAFLRRETVEVRLFDDPFLHAKAYLFPNYSIVGSSNLTVNGLRHNSELNTVTKQTGVAKQLREEWFERFWTRADDYKQDLIDELERSKFGAHPYTPFEVFVKVLFENFRDSLGLNDPGDTPGVINLAEFQAEGFRLSIGLLERFGGVMVADAVGLGKSFMGLSILEEYLIKRRAQFGGRVPRGLVVCPAQLEKLVWRPLLERYGIPAQVVSMESLGREDFDWKAFSNFDVVIVDESHNFRNPGARRYINLMRLLTGGRSDKRIALLTATPVNNTIWDFYQQVMLMTRGRDDAYSAYGVPSLKSFITGVTRGTQEFYDLVEHSMVRRSRRDVRRRQEQGEAVIIAGQEVRFPKRRLHRVEYSLTDQFGDFYSGLVGRIERLRLVAYNLERYKLDADATELSKREALTGIFKTNFLKRLESSVHALSSSIANQRRFQERFYTQFKQGRLLDAGTNRKVEQVLRLAALEDDAEGPRIDGLLGSLPEVKSTDYDVPRMEVEIQADLDALIWMEGAIKTLLVSRGDGGEQDAKVAAIKRALLERCAEQGFGKAIVFSYYHDTADYIYRALIHDAEFMAAMTLTPERVAFLSGGSNGDTRNDVVRRFAPRSNRRSEDDDHDYQKLLDRPIDLLISTDVLSEGQNLQDAGFLLNADLHWNPVRMIQRAGRIDRLGSTFEELEIANVFPEEGLEEVLGLVERLQTRIADIDRTVGLDASVLGEAVSRRSFEELKRIRAEDQSVLDELEQESELSYGDEMRLPLISALQLLGEAFVEDIPLGTHSVHASPEGTQGIFFAFRVGERVLWRVYSLQEGAIPLTSKREIYRRIAAQQDTPRAELPAGQEVYPFLEQAIKDILAESTRAAKKSRFKVPLKGNNLTLSTWLQDAFVRTALEASLQARLLHTLENRSLSGFERDPALKAIIAGIGVQQAVVLAADLEGFFVDNKLLVDQPSERVTIQDITRAQVELIAYEWLT